MGEAAVGSSLRGHDLEGGWVVRETHIPTNGCRFLNSRQTVLKKCNIELGFVQRKQKILVGAFCDKVCCE